MFTTMSSSDKTGQIQVVTVLQRRRCWTIEAVLTRKTLENEILKDAVEYGKSRNWIARSPLLLG